MNGSVFLGHYFPTLWRRLVFPFPFLEPAPWRGGIIAFLAPPFPAPPRLGCPLRWWGLGRLWALVATPCTRAPPLVAPRVLLQFFRTRAPLLRAQVWLFGCPFLRSPKHPLAGWLARLRAPSIPVVGGVFSGPLRGGPFPCGLLAPAFSRCCTLALPFSRPPSVGLSPSLVGSWSAAGFGGDPLHSRTHFGGASRSFTPF